jgi:hypothetical protein
MNIHGSVIVKSTDIQAGVLIEGYSKAKNLEDMLGSILIDPKPGLYKPGDTKPCVTFDGNFFRFDINRGSYTPIYSYEEVHGTVVNNVSRVVLSEAMSAAKDRFLTMAPTVPSVGLDLLEILVDIKISESLHHTRSLERQYRNFFMMFKQDPEPLGITVERLVDDLGIIKNIIHGFMNNDEWCYYFVSQVVTDILIEKGADYRICDWYETQLKQNDHTDLYSSRIHSLSVDYKCR